MFAAISDPLARIFAWPLTQFYALTKSYAFSIMLITVVVMLITTPLTLKSTKGMLEMQRLQPELRRLQQQYKGDRQKLNEEMMKLYQEHKVNPLASCFPLLLQMPVFIGMYSLLRGLTRNLDTQGNFAPRIISHSSRLYKDLSGTNEMLSWGLDLAKSPQKMFQTSAGKGVLYVLLVVILAFLYWVQQRMIANRSVSPTMSATQAKVMQYLPVSFAVIQIFFPLGLVLYYMWQTVLRIGQQYYITRRFYHGEGSLGHQAHQASQAARELAKQEKQAKGAEEGRVRPGAGARAGRPSVPAKGRPAAGAKGRPAAPAKGSGKARPAPSGRPPRPQTPARGTSAATPPPRSSAPARSAKPAKPVKPVKPQKPQKPQT